MKKVLKSAMLLILVLSLSLTIVPSVYAISTTQKNKSTVYRFLTGTLGFNRAAACGIMANIERESDFNPSDVYRDSNGLLSGGLCSWNGSRFNALKSFCEDNKLDAFSVTGQMKYLQKELNGGYSKIKTKMKSFSNSKDGAYDAGYYWCYYYEIPANRSNSAVSRGNLAKKYFENFTPSGLEIKAPTLSVNSSDGKVSLLSNLKLTWTKGGKDCYNYLVEIARKKGDSYDWKKASTSLAKGTSFSIFANELGTGQYCARVTARDDSASTKKTSKTVSFKISCTNHIYTAKVTTKASAEKTGTRTYTCSLCKAKTTTKIANGSTKVSSLSKPKMSVSLSGNGSAKIKVSNLGKAEYYTIYVQGWDGWVKLCDMPATKTTVTLPDMYSGAKLKLISAKGVGTKTVKSASVTATIK